MADKFPAEWRIPFEVACSCAKMGRLKECEQWFKQAMAIDEDTAKQSALDDPDCKALWDSMSGTFWKRPE